MENSSITKRLIDFGIDDNEYDEVLEPDDQPNSQKQQHNNNQNQKKNQSQHKQQPHEQPSTTPPQLPPPKQNKSVKNSNKNSSKKTKIPRSPSCASSLSYNNSFIHQHTSTSPTSSATSSIPPQTPPLPASYQNKNKHMNGSTTTIATPIAGQVTTPTTPIPTTPTVINNNNNNNQNNNVHSPTSGGLMGGGVMGANGNHAQQRAAVGAGGGSSVAGSGSGINLAASRRPQIQISPIAEASVKHYQYMTLTVRKDENGYGMKVSGDNPVYVESVKPGGAAQIAGLVAGDMILKVNGQEVRSEKHPTVVSLIKASTIVELAVKRTPKMARPTSVGIVPSTPILSGRDRTASITGPQPVDSIKRREMETYKIQTLQKMLEQEKLNLERLKGETNNPSYKLSEANIRKLREQLRQVGAEALGQTPPNLNHFNKHRRVVSSPENMHPRHPDRHIKTTSGSWDLIEKDGEITPPGTPPPPYPTSSAHSMKSVMSTSQHTLQGSFSEEPSTSTSTLTKTSAGVFEGDAIFVESQHFTPLGGASGAASPTLHSAARNSHAPHPIGCQKDILSMEDDDGSDPECIIDENGPFNYLQRLLEQENVAFLAVFLNFVLSNSDPAPMLFYLITGLYKEGTAKDMRKWAYEIHSTFLVPRAPLSWYRQDESLAREVDNVLQSEFDKVEILRKVFWKSRKRARDIICEQLDDFQSKRTAGLGSFFGPSDMQLADSRGDKQKEQHIFEETLLRQLQMLIDDYEKDLPVEDPKKLALCSALSTVIHRIFITRSNPNSIIDRVHHFVSREKSFKSRLMGKTRKMNIRGHPLVLRQYYEVTHCNHCQTIIWGVSPQGYHCTDCKLNIHRPCSKVLDENCPGPLPQAKRKDPHNDNKISKFMGKIRPRTSSDFITMEKRARHEDDFDPVDFANERLHSTSIVRQPSDRRPDAANTSIRSNGNTSQHNSSDLHGTQLQGLDTGTAADVGSGGATSNAAAGTDGNALDAADSNSREARRERLQHQHQQNKSAPVSVNRSESYKERLSHKRNRNSRRKTSDPSLTSRPNDEQPDLGLSNSNYTASSNSSLSSGGGSESPSTSMEQMTASAPGQHQQSTHAHQQHHHHHHHQHSHQDSFHGSTGSGTGSGSNANNISFWSGSVGGAGGPTIGQLTRQWQFESDEEDDLLIEADWSSNVAAEMLSALTDAEKKRQEIINEIYQTERNHVRTLKLLERLFFCPLQESGVLSIDHLLLLFPPALLTLRELHSAFEQKLKQRRIEHNHVVNTVGDLLAGMFDGQSGDELREYAAQFCARQQIALEALKEKRRKDEQLQKILTKAESHKACRRLQLKDLLPTVLQRLTKYPLLFENLYKVTIRVVPDDVSEAEAIQRALESSKKILVDVNQAVKLAEDAHKLQNIQRKLDKSTFDKEEFKNLDLTQHRLIHDGSLTMKKNPGIQLHGLLFESMIVLLTKQDDKYSLKYLNATRISEVNNKPLSPIMNIDSETLVRQEAADKNSFFLIKTKTSQMLELRAPSSSECKTWFKHISDAAEQYKPRSKNANHEPVDDPAIATLPHSSTKESLELTPERPPPVTATATMTTTPLAPMMMMPNNNQHSLHQHPSIDIRSDREGTPASDMGLSMSAGSTSSARSNQHMNNNDLLSSAVNRTLSTRSCGENNNNNYNGDRTQQQGYVTNNGVILRHTQSARQATNGGSTGDETGVGSGSKRDSNSIIYSNNSNNTRTLMQSSAPLVEPTAIQISISPAHTAEPVLTPAEKLRRLDAAIRDGLLEKQKIICDMFRLPIEHFHEIVDIASLPEAPKDSADIALAAYAQVQSLTEVVNDYMKVTPEQEISAVSTSVCDQCHEKQRKQLHSCNSSSVSRTPLAPMSTVGQSTASMTTSSSSNLITKRTRSPSPPPLPPPNKQQAQAQHKTATPPAKLQTLSLDEQIIHEDDDGYCEIDELRLPAIPSMMSPSMMSALLSKPAPAVTSSAPPPLPPPAGTFKVPPTPPPPPSAAVVAAAIAANATSAAERSSSTSPELTKRQSTISADSIPEESADEVTQAMDDEAPQPTAPPATLEPSSESVKPSSDAPATKDAAAVTVSGTDNKEIKDGNEKADSKETVQAETVEKSVTADAEEKSEKSDAKKEEVNKQEEQLESTATTDADVNADSLSSSTSTAKTTADVDDDDDDADNKVTDENEKKVKEEKEDEKSQLDSKTNDKNVEEVEVSATQPTEPQRQNSAATTADAESLDSEAIEIQETYEALVTLDKLNTALSMVDNMCQTTLTGIGITTTTMTTTHCGPNRIMHATSLEPSVPCHALNSIVTALNSQISLLLPKINERDMERERLRKENQHLRELLNAMHERQRVEAKMETPKDITTSADANDEIDAPSKSATNNNNTKSTTTAAIVAEAVTATATAPTTTEKTTSNSADANATAAEK